jgi:integrase
MVETVSKFPHISKVTRKNKNKPDAVYWQLRHSLLPMVTGKPTKSVMMPTGLSPSDIKFRQAYDSWMTKINAVAAKQKSGGVIAGSVAHLMQLYRGDEEEGIEPHEIWSTLSESTQRDYKAQLDLIVERWGIFDVNLLDEELTAALRDDVRAQSGPRTANKVMVCLGNLQKVALENKSKFGLPPGFNFARGLRRFGVKQGIVPREAVWNDEQEARFLEVCRNGHGLAGEPDYLPPNRMLLRAYLLLVMTGQRLGDVLRMRVDQLEHRHLTIYDDAGNPQEISDWGLSVRQSKRNALVWIRCHRDLLQELLLFMEMNKKQKVPSLYFIQSRTGKPYKSSAGGFPKLWRRYQQAAECEGLQRRDLRRTTVTRLYEVNCSKEQIRDITGHSLTTINQMLEVYSVRTGLAGASAIEKLEKRRK